MSRLRQTLELARRDFSTRARSRAFMVTMLLIVGLVLAAGPLLAMTVGDPDPSVVGLTGELAPGVGRRLSAQADAFELEVVQRSYPTLAAGEEALLAGRVDVLLAGHELVWAGEPRPQLQALVTSAVIQAERMRRVDELGLTPGEIDALLAPVTLSDRSLEPADPEAEPRRIGAMLGLLVLYMSILLFGQFVLMGVMEEKQSRVVEVVLSRVSPGQVLTGKVAGIGLLGLLQLVVLGAAGLVTLALVDMADVDLGSIGLSILASVVVWFLVGYAFYSVLYGALGATVSRQEDVQGVALLPVLVILPGFFIAQIAMEMPDATLVTYASLVPLWSPMLMPVRAAVGTVPVWQVVLAVALVVVTTYGMIKLAGRIYAGAVLRMGPRIRLREAWRSAAR